MARHGGANGALAEGISTGLDRVVSRAQFPDDASYNAFVAGQGATADKIVMPLGEKVELSRIKMRRVELTGAGTVFLTLAAHEGKLVELTDAATTGVNVAAFAVAKTDGQPIEYAEVANLTGSAISVAGGVGTASIPDGGILAVKSISGGARAADTTGVAELAPATDGSILVQISSDPKWVVDRRTVSAVFRAGDDGTIIEIPAPFDGQIVSAGSKVGTNTFDYTVSIAAANGTSPAAVTGLSGVTVNTATITSTAATGARDFTEGQIILATIANSATAEDGFLSITVIRTGE